MEIVWNRVTRFSQLVAIVLFVLVYLVGFQMGKMFENKYILGATTNSVKFICADNKMIGADFYKRFVRIELDSRKNIYLPQTMSASGARYANDDESLVFWNKGDTAFITEGDPNNPTYKDCVVTPEPAR